MNRTVFKTKASLTFSRVIGYILSLAAGVLLTLAAISQSPDLKDAEGNARFVHQAAVCMAGGGFLYFNGGTIICGRLPEGLGI